MIIRDATDADIPEIQSIYAHHVLTGTGTFEEEPPSVEEMFARFRRIVDRGWHWLVAADESGVLGFGYYAQFRDRSAYRFSVEDSIYVREDVRGQGVGKALVQALIEICTAAGIRQMIAVIGDSDNVGSIGVHASLGFRRVGTLREVGDQVRALARRRVYAARAGARRREHPGVTVATEAGSANRSLCPARSAAVDDGGVRVRRRPAAAAVHLHLAASGCPRAARRCRSIGLTATIGLAYSLKFLWSPVFDQVTPPGPARRLGRRRGWLAAIQPTLAAAAALLALTNPASAPAASIAAAALVALLSASQDIAIDAWRIETFPQRLQGRGAGGLRLGLPRSRCWRRRPG